MAPRYVMPNEIEVLLTIFGGALCLGGWVLAYWGSRVLGAGVGLGLGLVFGMVLGAGLALSPDAASLVELGAALTGAMAGVVVVKGASTFLFGATGLLVGAVVGRLGIEAWHKAQGGVFAWDVNTVLMIAGVALAMGLAALKLRRPVLIVATAFVGATFLAAGVEWLALRRPASELALFAASILWQSGLAWRLLASPKR